MKEVIEESATVVYEKSRKLSAIESDSRHIYNAWDAQEKARSMYFSEAKTLLLNYVSSEIDRTAKHKDATTNYSHLCDKHRCRTFYKFEAMIYKLTPESLPEVFSAVDRYDEALLKSKDMTERTEGRKVTQYLLGFLRDLERF